MRRRPKPREDDGLPVEFTECVVEEWADPNIPDRPCSVVGLRWDPGAWRAHCLAVNAWQTWVAARLTWADREGFDRRDLPRVPGPRFADEWPDVPARVRWADLTPRRDGTSWTVAERDMGISETILSNG